MWGRFSSDIPGPVSDISIPIFSSFWARKLFTIKTPLPSMAWAALRMMFINKWYNCWISTSAKGSEAFRSFMISMLWKRVWLSSRKSVRVRAWLMSCGRIRCRVCLVNSSSSFTVSRHLFASLNIRCKSSFAPSSRSYSSRRSLANNVIPPSGLLSWCATPAASFPKEDIFSACRSWSWVFPSSSFILSSFLRSWKKPMVATSRPFS